MNLTSTRKHSGVIKSVNYNDEYAFFQVYPSQGHVINKKMASYNQNWLLYQQPYFVVSGVSQIGIFRYNPILGYSSWNMEQLGILFA